MALRYGFIFIQIKKLTLKTYSNLSHKNISYYLKLPITIMHRHLFRKLSQIRDYVQTHCNDIKNSFQLACRKWYLYNYPQG